VNNFQKGLLMCLGFALILVYTTYANRTDPDLKDGIRCLVEQLAQHRVGSRNADNAAAAFHGYENNPSSQAGWAPPPTPTGKPLCDRFMKADDK